MPKQVSKIITSILNELSERRHLTAPPFFVFKEKLPGLQGGQTPESSREKHKEHAISNLKPKSVIRPLKVLFVSKEQAL